MGTSASIEINARALQAMTAPLSRVGGAEFLWSETMTDGLQPATNVKRIAAGTLTAPAAGNADHDLATLREPDGSLFSDTTKIVFWAMYAPKTNAAIVEVKASAANGLLLLKDVSDVLKIEPGGFVAGRCPTGIAFDGTHKSVNAADAGTAGGTVTLVLWGV